MAVESIIALKRPGFPKKSFTETSLLTTVEYVGISGDLEAAAPNLAAVWGEYRGRVTGAVLEPFEGTEYGILTVTTEEKFSGGGEGTPEGELQEVTTEIDWVDVQRSMYEHPEFSINGTGTYKLTSQDIAAIKLWENEKDENLRKDYKYTIKSASGSTTDSTLSTNAKMFARGIELGIEYWVDKAPVARWSGNYCNGPPPAGSAGQKQDPTGVAGIPSGYQWIRSADRGIKQGGQTRWTRNIEWLGSKEVLVDVDEIFWTAPE